MFATVAYTLSLMFDEVEWMSLAVVFRLGDTYGVGHKARNLINTPLRLDTPTLVANVRLGRKSLSVSNTLA